MKKLEYIKLKPNYYFFLAMLLLIVGCQSRPAIQNGDLNHYRSGKFVNLYKPHYSYGYHQSELDEIQYLKPAEIEEKHYALIYGYEPAKQINRTKGYDPAVYLMKPDLTALAQPEKKIRITWLGHACFLIQFADGTSILTDPVLGEMDGAAGFTANILDADAFKRVSPPVTFSRKSIKNTATWMFASCRSRLTFSEPFTLRRRMPCKQPKIWGARHLSPGITGRSSWVTSMCMNRYGDWMLLKNE